jgi:golgin subfamily A member 4
LANENRFIKEVQETISSLNSIVKNTREQLEANIAGTQTMMTENLRNVAKTMEVLKENIFTKMNVLDGSMIELNKRMANTIDAFNDHTLTTNETLEKEFNRVENMNRKLETLISNSLGEMNTRIDKDEEY